MLRKRHLLLLFSGLSILLFLLLPLAACIGGTKTTTGSTSPIIQTTTATDVLLFNNNNIGAVDNNPTNPTTFTLTDTYKITSISDYHWNYGSGVTTPGTIGLKDSSGKLFGPWNATGSPGQGGVPNALWTIQPNTVIGPGTYTIVDSDPVTWSQNSESKNQGMTFGVRGVKTTTNPTLTDQMVMVPLVTKILTPSTTSQQVSWNNQVTVTVPGGLLSNSQPLTISRVDNALPDNFTGFGELATYDVSLGDLHEFSKNLTIEIAYDPAKLDSGLPEDQSVLAEWWDSSQNTWWRTESQVDTQRHMVVISASHLTRWRIEMVLRSDQEWPSKHFIVVWNAKEPPQVGTPNPTPGKPNIMVTQDPKDFAKRVSGYLEAEWQVYLAQGYDVALEDGDVNPSGFPELTPAIGRTWVVIDQAVTESLTDKYSGDITLKAHYDDDNQVKQDTAHELFHNANLNESRPPTFILSRWWDEACADYAATRVAWPNLPGMSLLSDSFFGTKMTTVDDVHEYENARFVEYLVSQGVDFYKLFYNMAQAVATPASLDTYLQKVTGKNLLELYRDFMAYALFDAKGPLNPICLTPSLLNGLTAPKGAPRSLAATANDISYQMTVTGQYTASLWGFSVATSDPAGTRTLKVTIQPLSSSDLTPGKASFGVYILHKDQRVTGGGKQTILSSAALSTTVTVSNGDVVYILGANAGDLGIGENINVTDNITTTATPSSGSATRSVDIDLGGPNGTTIHAHATVTLQADGGSVTQDPSSPLININYDRKVPLHITISGQSSLENADSTYHIVFNFDSFFTSTTDKSASVDFTPDKGPTIYYSRVNVSVMKDDGSGTALTQKAVFIMSVNLVPVN